MDSIPTGWLSLTLGLYFCSLHHSVGGCTIIITQGLHVVILNMETLGYGFGNSLEQPLLFVFFEKYKVWLHAQFRSSQGGKILIFCGV